MLYVLGMFFLVMGIISYWVRILQKPNPFKGSAKKSFISTLGKVTQIQIGETVTNGNVIYRPLIEYEYIVGVGKFCGNKIGAELAGFGVSDKYFVESFLSKYKVNQEVQVFFDKKNPSDCYLIKKVPVSPMERVMFIVAILVGLGMLIYKFDQ